MSDFTEDWVTEHIPVWERILKKYAGKPHVAALEIGVFEGRATHWFLSQILTHETSHITCIDPCVDPRFFENIKPFSHKVKMIQETSQVTLRDRAFRSDSIAFAYVDGDHRAPGVLEDAVLCFRLLAPGGILIFDDYSWKRPEGGGILLEPRMAIDAFLTVFEGRYSVLHKGYQVAIEKISAPDSPLW